MRKRYSKPEIVFESFSLSTSIAAGCELDTPLASYEANCGYPMRGAIIFTGDAGSQCTYSPPDGMHDGFCYHVPVEDKNLFNS